MFIICSSYVQDIFIVYPRCVQICIDFEVLERSWGYSPRGGGGGGEGMEGKEKRKKIYIYIYL